MSIVQGKDVLLKIYKGGTPNAVACNASCSLSFDTDIIEVTTYNSGAHKQWIPGKHTIVLNGSGPIFLGEPVTIAEAINWQLNRSLIEFDFELTDGTDVMRIHGMGYFIKNNIDGTVGQAASCDYTIQVNGVVTFYSTNSEAGADDDRYWDYDATDNETTYADPEFEGATVVYIGREGVGVEMITTGVPNSSQVLFNSDNGSFTFGTPLVPEEWLHIIYQRP
ncbi:MAG: phage tail tube protein [Agriterribacter sp.]